MTEGAPASSSSSGWQAAHVGFDHDELVLDGLAVWSLPWREEADAAPVMLAHPAHPAQLHAFTIYTIEDGARSTRFAAAELSNTVWGFYRWVPQTEAFDDSDEPANPYLERLVSPDGSLRVELEAVEWSNSHWVQSPRVTEVASERVLLDLWGTDWDAAVSFPRPRAVRLGFRRYHYGGGAEAEIDLAGYRYTLFEGSDTQSGPLSDLPEALEEASRVAAAKAGPRPVIAQPRPGARNWFTALLILVGALALIAVATAITLYVQGEPAPQKLDVVPAIK